LSSALAEYVIAAQDSALNARQGNKFKLAISGGSLPKRVVWDKWHVLPARFYGFFKPFYDAETEESTSPPEDSPAKDLDGTRKNGHVRSTAVQISGGRGAV
jgi:hypothetical protein